MEDTILIFTRKGATSFVRDGGTGNWKVRPERVNRLQYAVLCRNRHSREPVEGDEPHGAGFVVARISGVFPSPTRSGRSIIAFSEVADIDVSDLWPGHRNPTMYTSLEQLGIDPATLGWRPFPGALAGASLHPTDAPDPTSQTEGGARTFGDVIRNARAGLAAQLGIPEEAIEISIRSI